MNKYRCNHCGLTIEVDKPLEGNVCGYCGEGVFLGFASTLLEDQKDLDPKIVDIVNDNFEELL